MFIAILSLLNGSLERGVRIRIRGGWGWRAWRLEIGGWGWRAWRLEIGGWGLESERLESGGLKRSLAAGEWLWSGRCSRKASGTGEMKKSCKGLAYRILAERTGFEPVVGLLLRQFSKLVVSATHPPLLGIAPNVCRKVIPFKRVQS